MGWQTISGLPGKPLELTQGSETRQTPRLTVTFEMMRHEQQLSSQLSSSAGQGESQGSILGAGKGNPSNTNEETNVPTPEQSSAKAREEEQNKAVKSDQTNNKEAAASSNARKPSPAGEDKRTPAPGQKIENLQQRQAEFVRHIAAKTPHRPGLNVQAVQNLKNLAEKIRAKAQLLKGNGVTVLEARLSPAKLGTVRIQIEISGDQMRLILAAERPEAAAALQNARSDLAALVSDHGYNLTRCDVEDRYPQSRGSEMHPQGGTNRRGYRGQFEDESESSGQEDGQHPRRMIDWGYNTMELVA